MLKELRVKNFKGFREELVFDLSSGRYEFNQHIIKNNIVNKAIVFGKNGSGKTILGLAIFDIIYHLTDKKKFNSSISNCPYLNAYSLDNEYAVFIYTFVFNSMNIRYEYGKRSAEDLVYEKLTVNDSILINFYKTNDVSQEQQFVSEELYGQLDINKIKAECIDSKLSILKYIYSRIPEDKETALYKIIYFCEHMLWYRCLSKGNEYAGYSLGTSSIFKSLYENKKVIEFQNFLKKNGINYTLKFHPNTDIQSQDDRQSLYVVFGNKKMTRFESIASTGTQALSLYFYWNTVAFNDLSFLFIDEFDAFLHYQSAELILSQLNNQNNFQTIVTTHNTSLMNNNITRPDCCYIIANGQIKSLYNCTDREIREAHNLEKMYHNGVFDE